MRDASRPTTRATEWIEDAECRGIDDPDVFFASGLTAPTDVRAAKEMCQRCPVLRPCLTVSLARAEPFGIFGGLDQDERRKLLRERRAADRRRKAEHSG